MLCPQPQTGAVGLKLDKQEANDLKLRRAQVFLRLQEFPNSFSEEYYARCMARCDAYKKSHLRAAQQSLRRKETESLCESLHLLLCAGTARSVRSLLALFCTV